LRPFGPASHAATKLPPSLVLSCRSPAGELVTLVGRRNSPTRRADVRTPRRPDRRSSHTATVLPEASVASFGVSPNSPSVWTGPSLSPVVIRHCRRPPRLVWPRHMTVVRPLPG
jgi:hypothetical protein